MAMRCLEFSSVAGPSSLSSHLTQEGFKGHIRNTQAVAFLDTRYTAQSLKLLQSQ